MYMMEYFAGINNVFLGEFSVSQVPIIKLSKTEDVKL